MVIGVLHVSLFIPIAHSLKSKSRALKSIKDKIRHRFNVSVAEIGEVEKWQRAMIAVACINSDKRLVNSLLSQIADLVERQHDVQLVDYSIEFY